MFYPTNAAPSTSDADYPVEVIDLDRMNALAGKIDATDNLSGSEQTSSSLGGSQSQFVTDVNPSSSKPCVSSPSGVRIVQASELASNVNRGLSRTANRGRPRGSSSVSSRMREFRADPALAERDIHSLQDKFPYVSPATVHRVYFSCLQRVDLTSKELGRINELERRKRNITVVPEPHTLRPLLKKDADTTGMAKRVLLLDPSKTRSVRPTIGTERSVRDEDVIDTESRIEEFMSKSCICIVPTNVDDEAFYQQTVNTPGIPPFRSSQRGRPRKNPLMQPSSLPFNSRFNAPGQPPNFQRLEGEDHKPINLIEMARQPFMTANINEHVSQPNSVSNDSEGRAMSEDYGDNDAISNGDESRPKEVTAEVACSSGANGNEKKFFKHKRRATNEPLPDFPQPVHGKRKGNSLDNVDLEASNLDISVSLNIDKGDNDSSCSDSEAASETAGPTTAAQILGSETITPLEYFNVASEEEFCLVPTCSLRKAQLILTLRPFHDEQDFISRVGSALMTSSISNANTSNSKSGNAVMNSGVSTASAKAVWQGCHELLNLRSTVQKLLRRCEQHMAKHNSDEERAALFRLSSEVELTPELSESLKHLTPQGNNSNGGCIAEQPSCLNSQLRLKPFQLVGLNWLHHLHSRNLNGILADEMGLGKTIQSIAFLAYLMESRGDRGPHLVIVPTSTLGNWVREFKLWCPTLKVIRYCGSQEERKQLRMRIYDGTLSDFNVLLTSYNIAAGSIEDRSLMKRITFHCGIFDEAHMLKNMLSQRYRNFMNFTVQKRLLLTGTPIQNNITELFSLLSFLMPDLFGQYVDTLKKLFSHYTRASQELNLNKNGRRPLGIFESEKINYAKTMLKPFILRRLKSQVLSQLPAKYSEVVELDMEPKQRVLYNMEFEGLKVSINLSTEATDDNQETRKETVSSAKRSRSGQQKDTSGVATTSRSPADGKVKSLKRLMRLRKAANHPLMLPRVHYSEKDIDEIARVLMKEDPGHAEANEELLKEDLLALPSDMDVHLICRHYTKSLSKFLIPDEVFVNSAKLHFLDNLLPQMMKSGDRVLIFSQFLIMLDILEEYFRIRRYSYLRLDGSTPSSERQQLIDQFNTSSATNSNGKKTGKESQIPFIFLLTTRAGGMGINLSAANVVIIHDVDFNPQVDKQAEDRAHRVGQTRDVRVYRLIMKDTVEQAIYDCANQKLKLGEVITSLDPQYNDDDEDLPQKSSEEDNTSRSNGSSRKRGRTAASGNTDSKKGSVLKTLKDRIRHEDEEFLPETDNGSVEVNAQEVLAKLLSFS